MKILISLLGFILGFIVFMPRDNLFFELQKKLSEYNVYINSDIKNSLTSLDLAKGTVYINGMDIIHFKKCKLNTYLFYNTFVCNDADIASDYKLKTLQVVYSVINPLKISVSGSGNFGKINGDINLMKKEGKIYIANISNPLIKKILKKDKKGYFYYVKF